MKELYLIEEPKSTAVEHGSEKYYQVNALSNLCEPLIDGVNATITAEPINFLSYIKIKFENKNVTALIDTGSTVTVISKHFCKKYNIKIPKCETKRIVTLADGSSSEMKEWKKAKITLDDYMSISCDVLISSSNSYDLLFGLNACLAIGANVTPDFLRYYVKLNGKERFGRLPITK